MLWMTSAAKVYDEVMQKGDPRVADWFMMSSPVPSFLICLLYMVLTKVGPIYMANRKPFEIRKVMLVYNITMVFLSAYILEEFISSGWFAGYSIRCQPVDYSRSKQAMRMARACWWFYFSKFIELLDTMFFILRKKLNQVSFLHVFHHGIMPFSWWFGVKFVPGGFGTFHAMLNSFIHLVMYTYYGLSAAGPRFKKYLWWKQYMTSLQITQFIFVFLHASQLLFIPCNYPIVFAYWIALYAVIFLILFSDYFKKTYRSNSAAATTAATAATTAAINQKSSSKAAAGISMHQTTTTTTTQSSHIHSRSSSHSGSHSTSVQNGFVDHKKSRKLK